MHAQYEVSTSYNSKVMVKVNFFFFATDRAGKKLDAPEFHSGGIKYIFFFSVFFVKL